MRLLTDVQTIWRSRRAGIATVCVAGVVAMSVAACGSSHKASASSSTPAAATSTGGTTGGGANVAAAKAALAPYTGHPSAFPVSTPLRGKLPAGTKFAYMQCSVEICALVKQVLAPAVKTLGGSLSVVNSGSTAQQAQAAASSVLAMKPKALLVTGVSPSEYGGELKKIQAAGTKIVSISIAGPTKQYGINFNYIGLKADELAGRLMADWVVAHKGASANVVYFGVPGIQFNPYEQAAFKNELSKNCPSCKLKFSELELTAAGTTAPQTITSYLTSHPSTNMAVLEDSEDAEGLPSALKSGGLSPTILVDTAEPQELQYIKDGEITAGVAEDIPTEIWTSTDIMARLVLGDPLTPGEQSGLGPLQVLGQKDITFDPAHGYSAYPDFAQRFAKLWHAGS